MFKKGQRFRAGIEGRISVLFRGRGMKRCRTRGRERFAVLVGAAVLANNLLRIAAILCNGKPHAPKRQHDDPPTPAAVSPGSRGEVRPHVPTLELQSDHPLSSILQTSSLNSPSAS